MKDLKFSILFFLAFTFSTLQAQVDTCKLRVSLLTCAPGSELYSTFGHTAVRIYDSSFTVDYVFNFGTFDFSDPNFYSKFITGKLKYYLSIENYKDFVYQYNYEQRSIREQVLHLSCEEKDKLLTQLKITAEPEFKYYQYDFLYNNCTSRVRDLILNSNNSIQIKDSIVTSGITFRNLLYEYLNKGHQPWSKLGIDILLGSTLDKPVTQKEAMFLPDYLMKGIDTAYIKNSKLVKKANQILDLKSPIDATNNQLPLFVFSFYTMLILLLSVSKNKTAELIIKINDSFLFYSTGLLGVLLLFMWFGTNHQACKNNFNLLWALPTNIPAAYFLIKKPTWLKTYLRAVTFINCSILIMWMWLPQQLNISLVPIIIILAYRSIKLSKE